MTPSQLEVHPELNEDCADTKGNLIMKKECDVINGKGQVKHPFKMLLILVRKYILAI